MQDNAPNAMATSNAPSTPASTAVPGPAPSPQLVIEQYKAKLADLGNLGVRQTTMTTYYVSILSALFGVLAFKDRSLAQVDATVVLAITVPGVLVSVMWFFGVSFFRNLFRAKIQVLQQIEKALPFQTFSTEFEQMKGRGRRNWLWVERFVPLVFAFMFAGITYTRFFRT